MREDSERLLEAIDREGFVLVDLLDKQDPIDAKIIKLVKDGKLTLGAVDLDKVK